MQTKKQSLLEAISNTAVGFIISLISTFFIFPIVGIESSGGQNILVVLFFTVISIARSFILRRIFNSKNQEKLCNRVNQYNSNRCITCGVKAGHNCGLEHKKTALKER